MIIDVFECGCNLTYNVMLAKFRINKAKCNTIMFVDIIQYSILQYLKIIYIYVLILHLFR